MAATSPKGITQFQNLVGLKFLLYNSLFTSLPFHSIEKTGILLSLLSSMCEEGYAKNQSPKQILEDFFNRHTQYSEETDRANLLFGFIQYTERQVVLFDALEDAAFAEVNDLNGQGTLKHLQTQVADHHQEAALIEKLQHFGIRLVLTAHPTQFYPDSVLGILNDLSKALNENDTVRINTYLQQLGKTPFFKQKKPTPLDEAYSLIWYLENVFYPSTGRIINTLKEMFPEAVDHNNPIIKMGFWPGGDRDGNPNVRADTTRKVAEALRGSIIKCYYLELRRLKRRLTFKGIDVIITDLEKQLYNNIFIPGNRTDITKEQILHSLNQIREILLTQHNGLFLHLIDSLVNKVNVFGLHFASLDIRQDSSVHGHVLRRLQADGKSFFLLPPYSNNLEEQVVANDALVEETLQSVRSIADIQAFNGPEGCHRYIISQCGSVNNVLEVMELFCQSGYNKEEMPVDIIPLFETVEDLKQAGAIMQALYAAPVYKDHLQKRNRRQTIMLGFSDGTKDGGYLMANWSIYKAKEELTAISRAAGIEVLFFDGRGGPPARGGGKTHKFYASMGKNIANTEIQLTVQGQTVSSNFGIVESAQFNMEQLLNAGVSNDLFSKKDITLNEQEESLLQLLAEESFNAYVGLKNHPAFLEYLSNVSPLRFYAETNIGSRPAKRNSSARININDLRAIPYVGAWSQLKQNVTGYYGLGTALKTADKNGQLRQVKALYKHSLFFKTLIDNCEMAMRKCYFPLTGYLSAHPVYGAIWNIIHEEYELTRQYVFKLSGNRELMDDYPVDQASIALREKIMLPLLTIQQFAMIRIREMDEQPINTPLKPTFEKLVIRSSFGIINASRNSA